MLFSTASTFAQGGTTGPLIWNLSSGTLTISGEGDIIEFMEFQHREEFLKTRKSDFTTKYLKELQLIADADFLNEFVMDQYGIILIIPEDTPDKYDEYLKWKSQNNISINLNELFYVVSYSAKKQKDTNDDGSR